MTKLGGAGARGALLLGILATLAACHQTRGDRPPLRTGYACCNLHYEEDWINDGNYAELPMIPAGTPIKVYDYGGDRADVDIGGKPFRLGHDYGREQESLEQWVAKIVASSDPKLKIREYSQDIQEAIRLGKVMPGMTREQAIIAIGYPLTSENASLDAPMWRHWISSFGEYQLMWDKNGRLKDVVADPVIKTRVVYLPPPSEEAAAAARAGGGERKAPKKAGRR
jgi:hypothetical protein